MSIAIIIVLAISNAVTIYKLGVVRAHDKFLMTFIKNNGLDVDLGTIEITVLRTPS